ncbi:MAG: hypothetical protein JO052_03120, partial [Bradyrhizobium sp.]|nr:hypothetical protein [Bradyrhizobium sp.]
MRISKLLAMVLLIAIGSLPPEAPAGTTSNFLVGVNVIGIQKMSEQQQDELIAELQKDGVKVVRTGVGDGFNRFTTKAFAKGIRVVAIVYATMGGSGAHTRPADAALGLHWAAAALTDSDPAKFKTWLSPQLESLESAGVHLAAFELDNEINGPFFNGDFLPAQASGRVLALSDLDNPKDPEGQAISASYRAYLRVLAALKDVRDHSRLNSKTPVISAGLADGGLPGKKPGQRLDGVSIPATLAFMRREGVDQLADGYGVHVYPGGDPKRPIATLYDLLNKDAFSLCTAAKPCWLTEWGFNNNDASCPVDDKTRVQLI